MIRRKTIISHSAKGSTWEEHKYIKRINGLYYYPDSYEGGRHLSDEQKAQFGKEKVEIDKLSEDDVNKLALEGIRGNFGNGQERKENLGAHYQQVQDRINQVIKEAGGIDKVGSGSFSTKISSPVSEKAKEETKKAASKSKGVDLDQVYSVYNKRNKTPEKETKKLSKSNVKGTRYTNNRRSR